MERNEVTVTLYPVETRGGGLHAWELVHRPHHEKFNVVVVVRNDGQGGEKYEVYAEEEGERYEVVTKEVYDSRIETVMTNVQVNPDNPESEYVDLQQADAWLYDKGVRMDNWFTTIHGWSVLNVVPHMLARWEAAKLILDFATPMGH